MPYGRELANAKRLAASKLVAEPIRNLSDNSKLQSPSQASLGILGKEVKISSNDLDGRK